MAEITHNDIPPPPPIDKKKDAIINAPDLLSLTNTQPPVDQNLVVTPPKPEVPWYEKLSQTVEVGAEIYHKAVDSNLLQNAAEKVVDAAQGVVQTGREIASLANEVYQKPIDSNLLQNASDKIVKQGSEAVKVVGGALLSVNDFYQKSTDFRSLQSGNVELADKSVGQWGEDLVRGGINGGIDSLEKVVVDNNQKVVAQTQDKWYESLVEDAALLNNSSVQVTGGLLKGVGDLVFGIVEGLAHPIDATVGKDGKGGLLGIAEHDVFIIGSNLKATHGLVDISLDAVGVHYDGQGQYGNNFSELGNHLLNPLQQAKDDVNFNSNLLQGIVDPDQKGLEGLKEKPLETIVRAVTNIAPIAVGVGEAAGTRETVGSVKIESTPEALAEIRRTTEKSRLAEPLTPPNENDPGWYSVPRLDSLQRGTAVEAIIKKSELPNLPRPPLPETLAAGFEKGIGYDKTHLGAHTLGFSSSDDGNLVGASEKTNRFLGPIDSRPSTMRRVELDVMKAIDDGQTVHYRVTPIYDGNAPTHLRFRCKLQVLDLMASGSIR